MKNWKKLLCAALCAALLSGCGARAQSGASSRQDFTSAPVQGAPASSGAASSAAGSYRAMWFGYPDWPLLDTANEAAFTASVKTMLDGCAALGLDGVIVHVRPFGDAIYPSAYFPWSHLLTGTQGKDPGYDPLAIFVREAHARGLRFEAWINPYRLRLNAKTPAQLADSGIAAKHPDWVKTVKDGLYLDPASAGVQDYITAGVEELLAAYPVDGVQFDDYFYPTTEESFDAAEYAASGSALPLADWRRQNVNSLVSRVYAAVKAKRPDATFGISPQGNNDNNYNSQYSDVSLWLSTPGYVDYVMPQVYWGYHYTLKSGSDRYAFDKIVGEWMAMPRAQGVSLYFGLGAYRIGAGDGSAAPSTEWTSGHNLADMAATLHAKGAGGYALYSYRYLFANSEYADLAGAERTALTAANSAAK